MQFKLCTVIFKLCAFKTLSDNTNVGTLALIKRHISAFAGALNHAHCVFFLLGSNGNRAVFYNTALLPRNLFDSVAENCRMVKSDSCYYRAKRRQNCICTVKKSAHTCFKHNNVAFLVCVNIKLQSVYILKLCNNNAVITQFLNNRKCFLHRLGEHFL